MRVSRDAFYEKASAVDRLIRLGLEERSGWERREPPVGAAFARKKEDFAEELL